MIAIQKGLVLAGGGILGIAEVGALCNIKGITHYAGSSVGAVIAGLLAAGAKLNFLYSFLEMDFMSLFDWSLGSLTRLKNRAGLCSGDILEKIIGKALYTLTGNENITFGELYELTNKILVVTVTIISVDECETLYLNSIDNPNVIVKRALRCSSSYPFVFACMKHSYLFGGTNESFLSDGGILDNYPLHYLERFLPKQDIIGIKVSSLKKNPNSKLDVISFSKSIISNLRHKTMTEDEVKQTIFIVADVDSLAFNISKEKKRELYLLGKSKSTEYFKVH